MHPSWTNAVDHTSKPAMTQGRVDETSINIKKVWFYLYRAVDSEGNTLSVSLESNTGCVISPNAFSAKRCTSRRVQHLKRFQARNVQLRLPTRPYQFLVCRALDKNAAYPKAEASLKAAGILPQSVELTTASNT